MRIIKNFTVLIMCFFMFSCGDDDTNTSSIETTDVSLNILDNVLLGDVIGSVLGETSEGNISFSVKSQIPNGAIAIQPETGALSVANANLIDASVHPQIFAVVAISNGSVTKTSNVTINVDFAITIETKDFTKNVFTIENEDVIGKVTASTNIGTVAYRIVEEYPIAALNINETTGELKVANSDLIDLENPATAIVEVSNGNAKAYAQVIFRLVLRAKTPLIFDWESDASRTGREEVTQTKNGITLTATMPNLQLQLNTDSFSSYYKTTYPDTGWEAIEETVFYTKEGIGVFNGVPEDLTFTFSEPVILNKFYAGNVIESPSGAHRVIFSTADGTDNNDVVLIYNEVTIHEVVLNWTDVTSFTIKSEKISGTADRVKLVFDGILINDKIN